MGKFKYIMIGIAVGLILGITGGSLVMVAIMTPRKADIKKITTTQISGEKIEHDKWDFRGKSISFNTSASGRGEIKTEIPKTMVPEADAWLNNVFAPGLIISEKYVPEIKKPITGVGVSFNRRWKNVEIGGGPIFEFTTEKNPQFHSFGAFAEAKYWFKLPAKTSN